MSRSYVLLTCIPPTTGHLQLVRFAAELADEGTGIMLGTMPSEPMVAERVAALEAAIDNDSYLRDRVKIFHLDKELPQDPAGAGFRELWQGILLGMGVRPGDYLVGSEPYLQWCARMTGATFMPYDMGREINSVSGTTIRQDPVGNWDSIIPEFRHNLQVRVTIFGAESNGKTTLSRELEHIYGNRATVLPEYARGFLENTANVITTESMTGIWKGQAALQRQPFLDTPLIIQDTDLYSTWGYWQYFSTHDAQGYGAYDGTRLSERPPEGLRIDAQELKSDLYLVLPSVIPFEPDPLRYGGDRREISDDYWNWVLMINSTYNHPRLTRFSLSDDSAGWAEEARVLIDRTIEEKMSKISFVRDERRNNPANFLSTVSA